jgi:1-aminocyclopropane-1-carboxylate deaminase
LIQEEWVARPNPVYKRAGNPQLSRLVGAEIIPGLPSPAAATPTTLAELTDHVSSTGGKPYAIPAGASTHPLGGLGYARFAFETSQQEKELGVFFDTIITPAVSGSTLAGMIAGFKYLAKLHPEHQPRKLIGVDASSIPDLTRAIVLKIAKATAEKIGLSPDDNTEADVYVDGRYHAGSYGVFDKQTIEAIEYGARMDAFITDPVYGGKALARMLDMIRRGEITGGNVLFTHTGGQLALSAYSGENGTIE